MSEQNVNMAPLHEAREALLAATQKFNSEIEKTLTRGRHNQLDLLTLVAAMQEAWQNYDDVASTYMDRARVTQTLGRKIH